MSDSSYWLAFGDIHDNVTRLTDIPELDGAAGVIVTGDITFGGGIAQAERVLERISQHAPMLLAQIGNMDRDEITGWLEEKGWNLHARARRLFRNAWAVGVGCSPATPFRTPSEHPESLLAEWMEQALLEVKALAKAQGGQQDFRLALVSHTPPYGSACDRLHNGAPAGSVAVREFIEKHQPDVCLCGHIHESRAEDRIGGTHVVNPGTLQSGGYALVRERAGAIVAELRTL